MSSSCTVLIAAQAVLPALTDRASADGSEVLAFSDAEALRALEAIITRRPAIVALERLFAASPRGAALINRIKADPALSQSEIRVVSQEIEPEPAVPPTALPTTPTTLEYVPQVEPLQVATDKGFDQRGTRRAPRLMITGAVEVTLDGNGVTLVNLSTLGAQVVSPTVLKPNQRIRVVIADEHVNIRLTGTIAWAWFEIPPGSGPRYRAGIEFINPDIATLDAFCSAHEG